MLHWASWAAALTVELAALALLWDGEVFAWEQRLTEFLEKTPERERLFTISNFLTNTLAPQFLLFFALVLVSTAIARRWLATVLLALTFPLHVLAQFPKALVERPRPSQFYEDYGGFMSYPSGHAEFVITFYGLAVYLIVRNTRRKALRVLIVTGWLLLVGAVGLGRVATGRHWPIDILVSYVIGLGLLSGLVWIDRSVRGAATSLRAAGRPAA